MHAERSLRRNVQERCFRQGRKRRTKSMMALCHGRAVKALRVGGLALLALFALAGCNFHVTSIESYQAATTPNPAGGGQGDKYAYGGTAGASGGQHPLTTLPSSKPTIGTLGK